MNSSARFHHPYPSNTLVSDSPSANTPILQQISPSRSHTRGQNQCISHQSRSHGEYTSPYFQPQSVGFDFTKKPSHLHSTAYIPPVSRSINSNLFQGTSRDSPRENEDLDSFRVTFFRRVARTEDGTQVSEDIIPLVQFTPAQGRRPNNSEGIAPSNVARGIRLVHLLHRFIQSIQSTNRSNDHNEGDWNYQMDEGHNLPFTRNSVSFPFIIFSFGSRSESDRSELNSMLGNLFSGRPGGRSSASDSAINKLPELKYGDHKLPKMGIECTICQVEYKLGDRLVKLPCSHDYHKDCVVKWLKQRDSCPMCRRSIEKHGNQ